jgi:hypothetical protein
VKYAELLIQLLDDVVLKMWGMNVVEVIIDNTSYYVATSKLLIVGGEIVYCLDLTLESLCKFEWVMQYPNFDPGKVFGKYCV